MVFLPLTEGHGAGVPISWGVLCGDGDHSQGGVARALVDAASAHSTLCSQIRPRPVSAQTSSL